MVSSQFLVTLNSNENNSLKKFEISKREIIQI